MKILEIAKKEVGYVGGKRNNNKYNTWYYGGPVSDNKLEWCVVFIRWCFAQADMLHLFCDGIKTASCRYVKSWAINHGRWVTDDYKPGDLLLFDWDGDKVPDHIGILVEPTPGMTMDYKTIEGNTSGEQVTYKYRSKGQIVGAYRPDYPAEPTWSSEATTWATENGIVSGYGGGDMGWKDPVTREQLAVILYRYHKRFGGG